METLLIAAFALVVVGILFLYKLNSALIDKLVQKFPVLRYAVVVLGLLAVGTKLPTVSVFVTVAFAAWMGVAFVNGKLSQHWKIADDALLSAFNGASRKVGSR